MQTGSRGYQRPKPPGEVADGGWYARAPRQTLVDHRKVCHENTRVASDRPRRSPRRRARGRGPGARRDRPVDRGRPQRARPRARAPAGPAPARGLLGDAAHVGWLRVARHRARRRARDRGVAGRRTRGPHARGDQHRHRPARVPARAAARARRPRGAPRRGHRPRHGRLRHARGRRERRADDAVVRRRSRRARSSRWA